MSGASVEGSEPQRWWETRLFALAAVLLSVVPLLWPDIAPLVDLPGHIGRYRVELDLATSPALQRFYSFEWALIGNLGVDLLVVPLSELVGLEPAVKLIVLSIPALTVAGFLWVSREVHGRIPPTTLLALPLAYNYPFMFGFVNFALSMGLAFLAFALWLRLARLGRLRLRAALFVPISVLIWLTHAFGWGALGLLAFSGELVRQHDEGRRFLAAAVRAAFHASALALPLLLMLAWRSGQVSGETGDWFNFDAKLVWMISILRDRWAWLDLASLGVLALVLYAGGRSPSVGFSRNLLVSASVLLLIFLLLPRIVFGSAYADMRLAPYILAVAIIAIRMKPGASLWSMRAIATAGLAFLLIRTSATTVSFWQQDRIYKHELEALDHLPHGARLASFVGTVCEEVWPMSRMHHLPALALVRRAAFSNDQWSMAGAQLLRVRYPQGEPFVADPSQLVTSRPCRRDPWLTIDRALALLPRDAFDYVWLIRPPRYDRRLTRGLRPIWRSGTSVLFAVERGSR